MLSTNQGMNGPRLLETFQLYQLPLNISQDYTDPADGHVHRFQNRCLGTCSIKSGSQVYPNVTFYEITESEISDITNSSPVTEEEILESVMVDSKELPPKKRKRRRMIRYEIIFSVDKGPVQLTPEYVFFALPRDAVTECLIESAPHKLLFSFFPQSCGISQNTQCACHSYPPPIVEETLYKTKLEEFAAVCSTSCKLTLPDQSKSEGHVNSIVLTGVSHELYRAIKQMVSSYEIMCQNMMELMRLHHEKSLHYKAELAMFPEPDVPLPNQSDEEYQASKSDSSSDEPWDKDLAGNKKLSPSPEISSKKPKNLGQQQQQQQLQKGRAGNASNQIKKCLYCGSKSTPMWRRGPQGAGTLCNACGVKWKHGKILNGSEANEVIAPPAPAQRRGSKSDKKRKRPSASSSSSSGSTTVNPSNKRANKKRNSVNSTTENIYYDTFAVPAPIMPATIQQWEGQSASSSTSDSRSPLQSFSSSPNTSPSIATLMDQQDIKRDISSLMAYDTETLSVYVGEDAVEAAAVLTLLKRS